MEKPITVYNFEVEDFHTYFVSIRDVLVHNMCRVDSSKLINHGKLRAFGRKISEREYKLLKKATDIRKQADGAKVYIRRVNGKYNIMIERIL